MLPIKGLLHIRLIISSAPSLLLVFSRATFPAASESLFDRLAGEGQPVLLSELDGHVPASLVVSSNASPKADLRGCHGCVGRLKDSTSPLRMGVSA